MPVLMDSQLVPVRAVRGVVVAVLAVAGFGLSGCGPNCQDTCNKLYSENECGLISPGASQADLLQTCNQECESALDNPGAIREEYRPEEYNAAQEEVTFTNDAEVALWMECVAETACEYLDDGYCAPVW